MYTPSTFYMKSAVEKKIYLLNPTFFFSLKPFFLLPLPSVVPEAYPDGEDGDSNQEGTKRARDSFVLR